MSELGDFQDAFQRTLSGDGASLSTWLEKAGDMGVNVYRNTTLAGCVDALAASFPTVLKLTGETWFRAAAAGFVGEHPPTRASLITYGGAFPGWIRSFPPAADTPYLAAIAQIDHLWWEAYFSEDAASLSGDDFANLSEDDLDALRIELHPSVRLGAFKATCLSLWHAQQSPAPPPFALEDRPEWCLVHRPELNVDAILIGRGEYTFFHACAETFSIRAAADAAALADPDSRLVDIIALGLTRGAFARLAPARGRIIQ